MSGLFRTPGDLPGSSRVSDAAQEEEFEEVPGAESAGSPTPGDDVRGAGGPGARDSLDSRAPPPGVDTRHRRHTNFGSTTGSVLVNLRHAPFSKFWR